MRYCFLVLFTISTMNALAGEKNYYWVFLRDKEIPVGQEIYKLSEARGCLSQKSLKRRAKSMAELTDLYDVKVSENYLRQIKSSGAKIRTVSKWLNAVSIEADRVEIESLKELSFIEKIEPFKLKQFHRPLNPVRSYSSLDDPEYGPSFRQNEICRIDELHARGLSGVGVLICFLDTGARLYHEAFDSLNVIATRDFIFNDDNVGNEIGQDSSYQDIHGSATLSTACGYKNGLLVGPAYGASVMIAKTEWAASETRPEEDNYVAALEWADSAGADITSSSLGYIDWYTPEQLDGQTAVTTQAANIAVSRGILVVTSAGNERQQPWGHLVTPADADSILAVGAVDSLTALAGFSSPGPSADGRIKPDVSAQGVDVFCADVSLNQNSYFRISGTSLSCPIVAGLSALIMEAHPTWTSQQVRSAIISTASLANSPNNDLGYGIADGIAAADYIHQSISNQRNLLPYSVGLLSSFPNPVNGVVEIELILPNSEIGTLYIYDLLGQKVWAGDEKAYFAGTNKFRLDANGWSSGIYFANFAGKINSLNHKIIILK